MINLTSACFTVQDGKIVEGRLADFTCYIESTTRPTGVGYKYYATSVDRELESEETDDHGNVTKAAVRGDVWVLAKWATWGGPEVIVREFESKGEAEDAAEETYVHDILNNSDMAVHLDRASAEHELADSAE